MTSDEPPSLCILFESSVAGNDSLYQPASWKHLSTLFFFNNLEKAPGARREANVRGHGLIHRQPAVR